MASQDYIKGLDFFPNDPFIKPGDKPQANDLFLGWIMGELGILIPKVDPGSTDRIGEAPFGILLGILQVPKCFLYMGSLST